MKTQTNKKVCILILFWSTSTSKFVVKANSLVDFPSKFHVKFVWEICEDNIQQQKSQCLQKDRNNNNIIVGQVDLAIVWPLNLIRFSNSFYDPCCNDNRNNNNSDERDLDG